MSALLVFVVLLLALFALAFFAKRRFGVLGLALCAGALLNGSWTSSLTPLIERQGVTLMAPPLASVVAMTLTLAPAVLLLFSGPSYTKLPSRIAGSAMFALLAFVFLLEPLGLAFVLDQPSQQVYSVVQHFGNLIIVAGIGVALLDLLLTRSPKGGKSKGGH